MTDYVILTILIPDFLLSIDYTSTINDDVYIRCRWNLWFFDSDASLELWALWTTGLPKLQNPKHNNKKHLTPKDLTLNPKP